MAHSSSYGTSPTSSGLPSNWEVLTDDNGTQYYHDRESGRTQWGCPISELSPSSGLPSSWEELTDDNGKHYYHNRESGLTQWEYPEPENTSLPQHDNKPPTPPKPSPHSLDEEKSDKLLEAVEGSNIREVRKLVKCIDELDPDCVQIAYETAQEKGNVAIIKLLQKALKIEGTMSPKHPSSQSSSSYISRTMTSQSGDCDENDESSSNNESFFSENENNAKSQVSMENNTQLKEDLLQKFTEIYKHKNNLMMVKMKFEKTIINENILYQTFSFGKENYKATKCILLVGATGAGKTSLINSIINRVYGISFYDNFRIKIKEMECVEKGAEESQTEWISVYKLYYMDGMTIKYNLRIIDTPGLNDTRGLDKDKEMFRNLEEVLRMERSGVDEIHCIGIVTMASAVRLTAGQLYVYDGCMRLFGKDVKKLINIMATYADRSEAQITNGLKKAGVEYTNMFKFNNSSVYLPNNPVDRNMNKLNLSYWNFMEDSCNEFLSHLEHADGQSLTLTVETLENRRVLQDNLKEIQSTFLEDIDNALVSIKAVKESCIEKAFNCNKCLSTCHNYCSGPPSCETCDKLSKENGKCKQCNCRYTEHTSAQHFKYGVDKRAKSKREMRKMLESMKQLRECITNLKEKALLPNPMPMDSYMEQLIDQQEQNDKTTKVKLDILETLKEAEKKQQLLLSNPTDVEKLICLMEEKCFEEKGWFDTIYGWFYN